jgi:hypothetical protein
LTEEQKYLLKKLPPRLPKKSWKTPEEVRNFLKFVEKELQVTSEEDWYRVGVPQITELGGILFF